MWLFSFCPLSLKGNIKSKEKSVIEAVKPELITELSILTINTLSIIKHLLKIRLEPVLMCLS